MRIGKESKREEGYISMKPKKSTYILWGNVGSYDDNVGMPRGPHASYTTDAFSLVDLLSAYYSDKHAYVGVEEDMALVSDSYRRRVVYKLSDD